MRGQNPQTLDQREHQYQQDHNGNPLGGVSPLPRHEHHGYKEHHGTDHGEQHRLKYFPDAPKCRCFALHTSGFCRVNGLTDDDGIVHHNAQHQQKGEQRNHVESDAGIGEQEKRAEEGDGDTH